MGEKETIISENLGGVDLTLCFIYLSYAVISLLLMRWPFLASALSSGAFISLAFYWVNSCVLRKYTTS